MCQACIFNYFMPVVLILIETEIFIIEWGSLLYETVSRQQDWHMG